ncbi:MAG: hypothetical protein AAB290_02935 [Candidatus Eisenbacteria bacterium]
MMLRPKTLQEIEDAHAHDTSREPFAPPVRDAYGTRVGVVLDPAHFPPEAAPPEGGEVPVKVLTAFCLGTDPTGKTTDGWPGQVLMMEAVRARRLARLGFCELIVDRVAEAVARKAAVAARIEAAQAAANPAPPPPPPAPVAEPGPEVETLTVRTRKAFCLGAGHDVEAGVVMRMSVEDAIRRVSSGLVEIVEGPEPGPA